MRCSFAVLAPLHGGRYTDMHKYGAMLTVCCNACPSHIGVALYQHGRGAQLFVEDQASKAVTPFCPTKSFAMLYAERSVALAGVQARHPERQLHGGAPEGPLQGAVHGQEWHLRARVHHRPAPHEGALLSTLPYLLIDTMIQ